MTADPTRHPAPQAGFSLSAAEGLLLLDWKRRMGELYHEARAADTPSAAWDRWREGRDHLFAKHDRSPIPSRRRSGFSRLRYFAYDPSFRVLADVGDAEPLRFEVTGSGGGVFSLTRFAVASFELHGAGFELELYWIGEYRGGLFLPFGDATNGHDTYGGGRYLLDTLKGEDLGTEGDSLVLDFNFAYHPPCFHNPDWSCPLPPPANRMAVPIRAGERAPA